MILKQRKKAAIELSMATIVVVVLSLILLIMGFVLVRSIMCSAVGLTDTIGKRAGDQVDKLFSATGGEIQCIGQEGSPVSMVPGERNIVWCGVRADRANQNYRFQVDINNALTDTHIITSARQWFTSANFNRPIAPGDEDVKQIAVMNIPKDGQEGVVVFTVQVYKNNDLVSTKDLSYKVTRQGVVQGFIC